MCGHAPKLSLANRVHRVYGAGMEKPMAQQVKVGSQVTLTHAGRIVVGRVYGFATAGNGRRYAKISGTANGRPFTARRSAEAAR